MLFNSAIFLFAFLPVSLIGFYAVARLGRYAAALWLAAASLVFYQWWNPRFLILLVASIAFNYLCSLAILASAARPRQQALLLAGGITANLAALFYFKYFFHLLNFAVALGMPGLGLQDA